MFGPGRSSRVSITLHVANLTSRRFNQLHFITSGLFWLQLCPQNARHVQYVVEIGLSADIAQHTSEPIVVIKVAKSDLVSPTLDSDESCAYSRFSDSAGNHFQIYMARLFWLLSDPYSRILLLREVTEMKATSEGIAVI